MKKTILLLIAAVALAGCGTLDKTGLYQGDQILYQADVVAPAAFDVFQTFVKWEYDNRAVLASQPEIKKAADSIRVGAPQWKKSLIALRESYATTKSPQSKAGLTQVLAVIQTALNEATKYLIPQPKPAN